jgi:hypothetical protein
MTFYVDTKVNMDIPLEMFMPDKTKYKRGPFTENDYLDIVDRMEGLGRNWNPQDPMNGMVKFHGLDEQFAYRISSKFNKNIIYTLFGEMGSGKSSALLSLAISASKWMAYINGGTPEDYFTFDNVAIIDPVSLSEKLENLKKRNIYILDDFGAAFDARNFMSKDNKSLSHILQTCRVSNNLICVSAPHGALLDVNLHRLSMWYSEVSESHHDQNVSFIKVMKVIQMFREGKIRRVYQTKQNVSAVRYYAHQPPAEILKEYDIVREANAKAIANKRQNDIDAAAEKACMPKQRPGAKNRFSQEDITSTLERFVVSKEPTTQVALAEALETDRTTLRQYMKRLGYTTERVPKAKTCIVIKN